MSYSNTEYLNKNKLINSITYLNNIIHENLDGIEIEFAKKELKKIIEKLKINLNLEDVEIEKIEIDKIILLKNIFHISDEIAKNLTYGKMIEADSNLYNILEKLNVMKLFSQYYGEIL